MSVMLSSQEREEAHPRVYSIEELCDAHGVVEIWNRRVASCGFRRRYTTDAVRSAVSRGSLTPVERLALPVALRTEYYRSWFLREDAENSYLRPERSQYIEEVTDETVVCARDGCENTYPKAASPAPWYWCPACRKAKVRQWHRLYHEKGPNSHLSVPPFHYNPDSAAHHTGGKKHG